MALSKTHFGLAVESANVALSSSSHRPPSWPPPRDWVCVEDSAGNAITRWGDPIWDLSPWVGKTLRVNFGDGPPINNRSPKIDSANADILRLLITWKIWGPRGARSIRSVVSNFFDEFRKVSIICSGSGILATDLVRFPHVAEQIGLAIAPSKIDFIITELDQLYDAREEIGFIILDRPGIRRLKELQITHQHEQTEYIPPRIWEYQVTRLRECIDAYIAHQPQVEACFQFCLDAYRHNFGPEMLGRACYRNPFFDRTGKRFGKRSGRVNYGPFIDTAARFEIRELLEEWVQKRTLHEKGIQALASYLSLISFAGLAYVANFTLMRKEEAGSLRAACLEWHRDEAYGPIPIIVGETTKTEQDHDARWIASPSVEVAITALKSIAVMRLSSLSGNPPSNPHLLNWTFEPWANQHQVARQKYKRNLRPTVDAYAHYLERFPKLLDPEKLRVTEEDLKIARAVTPSLNRDLYRVGRPWPIAWHQLRRTGAVNMFASGKISDSSIQLQLKHSSRLMPLYYGRGSSGLRLDEDTRRILINAQYEVMAQELKSVQTERFISPHGEAHKRRLLGNALGTPTVDLISEQDAARYESAARSHQISFRRTVLGGCLKNGQCHSDSYESVAACAGGAGKTPCSNALFDVERSQPNFIRLGGIIAQLKDARPNTPRYRALQQEKRGLENYFAFIKNTQFTE